MIWYEDKREFKVVDFISKEVNFYTLPLLFINVKKYISVVILKFKSKLRPYTCLSLGINSPSRSN